MSLRDFHKHKKKILPTPDFKTAAYIIYIFIFLCIIVIKYHSSYSYSGKCF